MKTGNRAVSTHSRMGTTTELWKGTSYGGEQATPGKNLIDGVLSTGSHTQENTLLGSVYIKYKKQDKPADAEEVRMVVSSDWGLGWQ